MSMFAYLYMIPEEEIEDYIDSPDLIFELEDSDEGSFSTAFFCSLNYFVAGSAWPGQGDPPLCHMLAGPEEVSCEQLDSSAFFILRADDVIELVDALGQIDFDVFEEEIEGTDLEGLVIDESMEDGESLLDEESPSGALRRDLEDLQEFYQRAAEEHMAVLAWTA